MTIAQFAQSIGSTKQTAYRKLSNAGIDLDSIRGDDGQVTDTGKETLTKLLAKPAKSVSRSTAVKVTETESHETESETLTAVMLKTIQSQQETIEALSKALKTATEELEALRHGNEKRPLQEPGKTSLIESLKHKLLANFGTHSVPPSNSETPHE